MLPDYPLLSVIIISMLPWIELRGAIPLAILKYNIDVSIAFVLSVFGNMIPVPFILIFFNYIEKFLRRYPVWNRLLTKLFMKTRKRANKKIAKYETIGLLFFVAIPLPFTGAWTACLISYLFGLRFYRSILVIFGGVLVAGVIVTIITVFFRTVIFTGY